MSHLNDERLTTLAFQSVEPTVQELAHLDACTECRRVYSELTAFATDLTVFVESQPDADAMQRYYWLFDEVQASATGFSARMREWVAALSWDSRQQFVMQGVRSVAASEYRLVYATEMAEIELMIEIAGARRHLEGDLLPLTEQPITPALLQLHALDSQFRSVMETEINDFEERASRFQFQDLQPGHYRLIVTTALDLNIVIDELDIT